MLLFFFFRNILLICFYHGIILLGINAFEAICHFWYNCKKIKQKIYQKQLHNFVLCTCVVIRYTLIELTPFSKRAISLKPGLTISGKVPACLPHVTWASGSTRVHLDQLSRVIKTATAAELYTRANLTVFNEFNLTYFQQLLHFFH